MTKELLMSVTASDCRWEYFRGSGAGGQKRNKTSNCVRCTHEPSGAVGEARDSRSQRENRETAFRRMATSKAFQIWIRIESARLTGQQLQIEETVEKELHKISVECKNEKGLWQPWVDAEGC